jgi:hypothetical protein
MKIVSMLQTMVLCTLLLIISSFGSAAFAQCNNLFITTFDANQVASGPNAFYSITVNGIFPITDPESVRVDLEIFVGGVSDHQETETFAYDNTVFPGSASSNGIIVFAGYELSKCGDHTVEVTVTPLDNMGNACGSVLTDTDVFCVDNVSNGTESFSCLPCGGLPTARLAAPTALTLAVNPAVLTDRLLFETSSPSAAPATLRLLDLQGRAHFEADVALTEGQQAHKFALPELSAGVYLLQVATEREQVVQKVIVR